MSARVSVGATIREWRTRRRMSQLELALDAGVSTRHLSFLETGRSQPGRETLLRVLEHLDVPLRERNEVLLAAGHAPAFPERSLDDPELAAVRGALEHVLVRQAPYPAMVVDRRWNVLAANEGFQRLAAVTDVDPSLLARPANALRVAFHPRGMAPAIVNLAEWRTHFVDRLQRQLAVTGDTVVAALVEEILGYPVPGDGGSPRTDPPPPLGPVVIRTPAGEELAFFGMFAGFNIPFEVTTSELAVELLFPADDATAAVLRR